ncbi:MAG: hypothetical protein ACYCS7_07145 [Acidimicrobiales bacterium]
MPRDSDRARVYRAEEHAFEHTLYDQDLGPPGLVALARSLFTHPWWQSCVPTSPALVPARADSCASMAVMALDREEIRVAPGQENARVLAHEAAHLLAWTYFAAAPGHGREFRTAHLDVAWVLNGSMAADMLAQAYAREGLALVPRSWPAPPEEGIHGLLGRLWLKASLEAIRSLG